MAFECFIHKSHTDQEFCDLIHMGASDRKVPLYLLEQSKLLLPLPSPAMQPLPIIFCCLQDTPLTNIQAFFLCISREQKHKSLLPYGCWENGNCRTLCACRNTAQMNLIAAVYRSLTVFNLKRGCLLLFGSSTNQTTQLQVLSVNSFLFEIDQLSCRTIIRKEVWESWRGPWCKLFILGMYFFGNALLLSPPPL